MSSLRIAPARDSVISAVDDEPEASHPLRGAVEELIRSGALSVAFQPIVSFASGDIEGYEVLGRCEAVTGPLAAAAAAPNELLDVAYRCGRLLALDRRWRELAFEQIAAHADRHAKFFVNVDPRVVHARDYAPGFTQALARRHGIDPHRLVLELTETIAAPEAIEGALRHYAAQGFGLAVDDLGAGAQSLAVLLRLRPQFIKLDGSIVRGIDTDPARRALVRALVGFGEQTGARVIAEAIETEPELQAVGRAGAHCGQGFLLGRPIAALAPLAADSRDVLARVGPRSATVTVTSAGDPLASLLRLVDGMRDRPTLDAALGHVTAITRELLGVERVSLRLLDESRARLLVAARSGPSVHHDQRTEFRIGEGLIGWIAAHALPLRLARAEMDARFVAKQGQVAEVGSFVGVPLLDAQGCIGVLSAVSPLVGHFSSADEAQLRLVAGIVSPHLQIGRLERLAKTDPLTCVLNRHALDDVLPDTAVADAGLLAVAMFDIDHFKSINDRLGHAAGDEALRGVAAAIRSSLRADDHVLRVGGEEFLVVLPGIGFEMARVIAARAWAQIAALDWLPGERLTTSVGVAQREPREPRDTLLQRADAALYRAKARGRNCIVVSGVDGDER